METEGVKCRGQLSVELLKIYWEGKHFIDLGTSIMAVLHCVDLLTLLTVCVWSLLLVLANC